MAALMRLMTKPSGLSESLDTLLNIEPPTIILNDNVSYTTEFHCTYCGRAANAVSVRFLIKSFVSSSRSLSLSASLASPNLPRITR